MKRIFFLKKKDFWEGFCLFFFFVDNRNIKIEHRE